MLKTITEFVTRTNKLSIRYIHALLRIRKLVKNIWHIFSSLPRKTVVMKICARYSSASIHAFTIGGVAASPSTFPMAAIGHSPTASSGPSDIHRRKI